MVVVLSGSWLPSSTRADDAVMVAIWMIDFAEGVLRSAVSLCAMCAFSIPVGLEQGQISRCTVSNFTVTSVFSIKCC